MTKVASSKRIKVTSATVRNWVKRYFSEGESGLEDRSARRHKVRRAIQTEQVEEIIRVRKIGKLTGDHIAGKTNVHQRTVSRHLVCAKLSQQEEIVERDEEPPRRYQNKAFGDMVHLDIHKLRNFNQEGVRDAGTLNRQESANKAVGSQCMHVAIDDHSRYASESILVDETAECVTQHMIDTYQQNASQGILVNRVLTDYGSGYKSKIVVEACKTLSAKHVFTKPFRP